MYGATAEPGYADERAPAAMFERRMALAPCRAGFRSAPLVRKAKEIPELVAILVMAVRPLICRKDEVPQCWPPGISSYTF